MVVYNKPAMGINKTKVHSCIGISYDIACVFKQEMDRCGETMNMLKLYSTVIPSNLDEIGNTVSNVISYLQDVYGTMSSDTIFELKVVLNELLINAIKHGNRQDCTKHVRISAGLAKGNNAFLVIEDEGAGYDYTCLCGKGSVMDNMFGFCGLDESGRGMLIVRNLCDSIHFNKPGNKIVVYKKLS